MKTLNPPWMWERSGFQIAQEDTFSVPVRDGFSGWKAGYGGDCGCGCGGRGDCARSGMQKNGGWGSGCGKQRKMDSRASAFVRMADVVPHDLMFAPKGYTGGGNAPRMMASMGTRSGGNDGPCAPPVPWLHPCCACACPPGSGTSVGIAASGGNPTSPPVGGWDLDLSRQLCESTAGCTWSEKEECQSPPKEKECCVGVYCYPALLGTAWHCWIETQDDCEGDAGASHVYEAGPEFDPKVWALASIPFGGLWAGRGGKAIVMIDNAPAPGNATPTYKYPEHDIVICTPFGCMYERDFKKGLWKSDYEIIQVLWKCVACEDGDGSTPCACIAKRARTYKSVYDTDINSNTFVSTMMKLCMPGVNVPYPPGAIGVNSSPKNEIFWK